MTDDSQSLPRSYAVLTPARLVPEPSRAWSSLVLLGLCLGFWAVIAV